MATPGGRIDTLDLIRGVAVCGILAVNIFGFAGPVTATLSPHLPVTGTRADELTFATSFVLFEGKMRALFTMLFGASLILFMERAEAADRDGTAMQLRRLGWLALFGYLHYALFWWGDILFLYAAIGVIALSLRQMPDRLAVATALTLFAVWHMSGAAGSIDPVIAEERVRIGTASVAQSRENAEAQAAFASYTSSNLAGLHDGFVAQVRHRLIDEPGWPITMTFGTLGETLPLMLIGMALYRSGFFSGLWARRRVWWLGIGASLLGLFPTVATAAWLLDRNWPLIAAEAAIGEWMALPHLAMALGYAAMLVLGAPALLATGIGARIAAAGRMAFSNYIACTVAMTAIFYGWGLGLVGTVPDRAYPLFAAAGWAAMLAWSAPWLDRFHHGPLEWLWRCLTEGKRLPFKRACYCD